MSVLVIAPHPDDEAIGCGGTIAAAAERGERVDVVFLTSGELGLGDLDAAAAWKVREAEASQAADVLGLAGASFLRHPDWYLEDHIEAATADVERLVRRLAPDVVYAPHGEEWHPDHRAAFSIALAAAARCELPAFAVLRYEVWTPLSAFDVITDVTSTMPRKLDAVRCYTSQLRAFNYVQATTGLAQYRGALAAKTAYAEVFDRCSDDELRHARGAVAVDARVRR